MFVHWFILKHPYIFYNGRQRGSKYKSSGKRKPFLSVSRRIYILDLSDCQL